MRSVSSLSRSQRMAAIVGYLLLLVPIHFAAKTAAIYPLAGTPSLGSFDKVVAPGLLALDRRLVDLPRGKIHLLPYKPPHLIASGELVCVESEKSGQSERWRYSVVDLDRGTTVSQLVLPHPAILFTADGYSLHSVGPIVEVIDVVDGKLESYSLTFPSHPEAKGLDYRRLDHRTWIRTTNPIESDGTNILQMYRVVDQKVTFVSEWPSRYLDQPGPLFVTDGSTIGTAHPVEDVLELRDYEGRIVNRVPFPREFDPKNGIPRWREEYWESRSAKVYWDPMTLEKLKLPSNAFLLIARHAPSQSSAFLTRDLNRLVVFDESTSKVIDELPSDRAWFADSSGKHGMVVLLHDDPLRFETYDLPTRTHQIIDWRWKRTLWMGIAIGSYVLWCLGWIALSSAFRFPFLLDIAVMNLALLVSLYIRHDLIGVSWLNDEGESWLMFTIDLLAFSWMSAAACWFVFGPWRKLQKLNVWLASLGIGFLVLDWTLTNDARIGSIRAELFTSVLVSTIVSIFFFLFLRVFYTRLQKENSVAEMGDLVKHSRRPLSLSDIFVLLAVLAVCIRNYRVSEKWLWPLPNLGAFAVMFAVGVAVSLPIFALVQTRNRMVGRFLICFLSLGLLASDILFPEAPDSVFSGRLTLAFLNTWVVLAPFLVMRWHGWRLVRRAASRSERYTLGGTSLER